MNARKIPINLEVAFWNFVISTLTLFKSMRIYTQTTSTVLPVIRKTRQDKQSMIFINAKNFILPIEKLILRHIFIQVCFWAMFGFVMGLVFGLLFGS